MPDGEDYLHYYNSYDKRSELELAPGESIKGVLIFVVTSDVSPDSLYLDQSYYYSYLVEDSTESTSVADSAVESEASSLGAPSSSAPIPSGQCPACGSREF